MAFGDSPATNSHHKASSIESFDRLAQIYRTAAAIIVQKGFDATSMNEIASALDLTKAGLYHYIRGKEDLLFSIMQFAMDIVDEKVLTPARKIQDPEERLRFTLARHAGMTKYVKEITILAEEVAALSDEHRDFILERKRNYFEFVRATLVELNEQGKLRDLDPTIAALNIFGMVLGIARWYRPDGKLGPEKVAEQTSRLLLGGLLKSSE